MRLPALQFSRASGLSRVEAAGGIVHPVNGGGLGDPLGRYGILGTLLPASDINWAEEVGDPALNYAVFACLRWIADNLPEPEAQVVDRQADRTVKPRALHALLDLLEQPNPYYDGDSLLAATARDYSLTGNAYWLKERDNVGRVRALWYVPFWAMAPRWPADGSQFISDYLYRPGWGAGTPYRREDVVHFQWGLDSTTAGRTGTHRTQPVLHHIASLNEGAVYMAAILRNMGIVPNLITSEAMMSEPAKQGLREWWQKLFTRDGRGKPGVLDGGKIDVKQLGLSPEDLALNQSLQRPELAVCAAFGIPPAVIYLGQTGGANAFDNGGQHEQARKAAYHDCLIPMTKRFGKTLTHRLLPDFEEAPPRQTFVRWDFSEVEALAEDQNELFERNNGAVNAGWMMVSEARERAKLPVDETHKVFYRPSKSTMVKTADEIVEPPVTPGVGEDEDGEDDAAEPGRE